MRVVVWLRYCFVYCRLELVYTSSCCNIAIRAAFVGSAIVAVGPLPPPPPPRESLAGDTWSVTPSRCMPIEVVGEEEMSILKQVGLLVVVAPWFSSWAFVLAAIGMCGGRRTRGASPKENVAVHSRPSSRHTAVGCRRPQTVFAASTLGLLELHLVATPGCWAPRRLFHPRDSVPADPQLGTAAPLVPGQMSRGAWARVRPWTSESAPALDCDAHDKAGRRDEVGRVPECGKTQLPMKVERLATPA